MKFLLIMFLPLVLISCQKNFDSTSSEAPIAEIEEVLEIETVQRYTPIIVSLDKYPAKVNDDNVNFRSRPFLESDIIDQLHSGQEVEIYSRSTFSQTIQDETHYWYLIKANRKFGWIYGQFIDPIPDFYKMDFEIFVNSSSDGLVYSIIEEAGTTNIRLSGKKDDLVSTEDSIFYFNSFLRNEFSVCAPPGVYKFDSDGKFVAHDYIEEFKSPGRINNISPTGKYITFSIGVGHYGHDLVVYKTDSLELEANLDQLYFSALWVSENSFVYNRSFEKKRRPSSWEPYESTYYGISHYDVEAKTDNWIFKPNESYNFKIVAFEDNVLSYSEMTVVDHGLIMHEKSMEIK